MGYELLTTASPPDLAAKVALEVDDETPGPTSVVKLISSGTPKVSVRAI